MNNENLRVHESIILFIWKKSEYSLQLIFWTFFPNDQTEFTVVRLGVWVRAGRLL